MKVTLAERVRRGVWPRNTLSGRLGYAALRPLSGLFGVGVSLRNLGYEVGVLRSRRAAVPIVSVGNLAVGGTGKTPLTLWLGRALLARGRRVAILSRGYGGEARGVTVVSRGDGPLVTPAAVGDEPVMLGRNFPGPVLTAARRLAGAAAAAALGCDVVVLDDGFQHRAIARDYDIVLLDGNGGPLLPAGPWRERLPALQRASALVLAESVASVPPAGADKPVYRMRLRPTTLVESVGGQWCERPLAELAGKHVVAVCGIARPERFYENLRQWEAVIAEVFEYSDHHRYSHADWQRIARGSRGADLVVTTEKDLVKLDAFPFATGNLVALRIEAEVERGDELIDAVMEVIRSAPVSEPVSQ